MTLSISRGSRSTTVCIELGTGDTLTLAGLPLRIEDVDAMHLAFEVLEREAAIRQVESTTPAN